MSSERKIQQQYFGRAREGVFRTNEGLDTLAKSPSLDGNFIKKTLHPFCVYHPPQELSQRAEQDLSKYPESLTVFHAESGELVIGRSQFAGTDFTGQRDTIFVHNYVVPKERKEDFLRTGNRIFRVERFQTHYDIQDGKVLPELDDIAADSQSHLYQQQNILDRLKINDVLFKQLLGATMAAISSNKKVYVALDVAVAESAQYAKKLTEILFHFLPFELRRHFGFTTYFNEPQGKKFIDVMFVEKGSIRANDRSLDKDFVFDFPNERFVNSEIAGKEHYYLNFAWSCKDRPDALAEFFAYAEEALNGENAAKKVAPSTYHQLCALFQVDRGLKTLYEQNKEGLLYGILEYLDDTAQSRKQRLYRLFYRLVSDEVSSIHMGKVVSVEYLKAMIAYCRIADDRTKKEFVGHLVHFMFNNWKNNDEPNYTLHAMQELQSQPELFIAAVETMHGEEKYYRVFEDYFKGRAESIASVKAIQQEIEFWRRDCPMVVSGVFFLEQILLKIQQVLGKSGDRINGAQQLHSYVQTLESTNRDLAIFKEKVEGALAKSVLGPLELERVTLEDLENLQFLLGSKRASWRNGLEPKEKEKLQVLSSVSMVLKSDGQNESEILSKLDGMDSETFDQTRRMLRRLLKNRGQAADFKKVGYAFYRGDADSRDDYEYREMLSYMHGAGGDSGAVYEFIVWGASAFGMRESFKSAVRDFFEAEGKGALKSKSVRDKLMATRNTAFKRLIKEIGLDQSNFLKKFIVKHKRKLGFTILGLAFVFAVAGITVIVLNTFMKDADNPPPASTEAVIQEIDPTVPASETPEPAPSDASPPASGSPDETQNPSSPPASGSPGETQNPSSPPASGSSGESRNPSSPPASGSPGGVDNGQSNTEGSSAKPTGDEGGAQP